MKDTAKPLRDNANLVARERYEQAMVDADIEGLARSPEIEAGIAEWDAAGIDTEEQIRRLKILFTADRASRLNTITGTFTRPRSRADGAADQSARFRAT